MGIAYKCDKCGKIFPWYETFHEDKHYNHTGYNEDRKYFDEHGFMPMSFQGNCLKIMFYEPINDNLSTNDNKLSGEIKESEEGNNEIIILCADCMTEFFGSLNKGFWNCV